ncbi:MAG TPA: hypothetical protein V6C86_03510 [Oculatellaceae cyanobacterium]
MKKSFLEHPLRWQAALTCLGTLFALADFADYSIYVFIVPLASLFLLVAILSGIAAYKRPSQSMRSRTIAIACIVVCAIQLPDVVLRRLPATLNNPNIGQQQQSRAKAFEEAIEKSKPRQVKDP